MKSTGRTVSHWVMLEATVTLRVLGKTLATYVCVFTSAKSKITFPTALKVLIVLCVSEQPAMVCSMQLHLHKALVLTVVEDLKD